MTIVPFALSSSKGKSSKNNVSNLKNLFANIDNSAGKSQIVVMNTEGVELLVELNKVIYGIYEFKNIIYVATSSALWSYNQTSNQLSYISALELYKKVFFADNGVDIMFVGGAGYAYTPSTSTFKNMNSEDGWNSADTVAYLDGYFIFNRTNTGQFFISKLYSTELDAIDWASGESAPDNTIGIAVTNRQLFVFGELTTEVWYNSGDPDFPFMRLDGSVTNYGVLNRATISVIQDSVYVVGNNYRVYRTVGYQFQLISNEAIDLALESSKLDELTAFNFFSQGRFFYILHIDERNTFVFDTVTNMWHQRTSSADGYFDKKWGVDGAINLKNSTKILGYTNTSLVEISDKLYTDMGHQIKREMVSLPLNSTTKKFRLTKVQLDMEMTTGEEGKISLQTSHDSGRTWSNERIQKTNVPGNSANRIIWHRFGYFIDCIIRINLYQNAKIRLLNLFVERK